MSAQVLGGDKLQGLGTAVCAKRRIDVIPRVYPPLILIPKIQNPGGAVSIPEVLMKIVDS